MKKQLSAMLQSSLVCVALSAPIALNAIPDDALFYRAPQFFGEPRLARKNLSSLDFAVTSGSTYKSRNCAGQKTCLLNIYGPHNMRVLGSGVPGKDLTNPGDVALIELAAIPANGCFAELLFTGNFHITQFDITATQNLAEGFFIGAHIPYRSLSVEGTNYIDLSPKSPECTGACPNVTTPQWQTFLNLFPAILQKYKLNIGGINKRGIGDITLFTGWTYTYENPAIDFLDVAFTGGVIIPTGVCKNENFAFDLPLGYNGFTGGLISFDSSAGLYDWLTLGGHLSGRFFNTVRKSLRLKTDINQNGFIKLAKGIVCMSHGSIFDGGVFAKADHIARGVSLLVGFSYIQQNSDSLMADDNTLFPASIINSDAVFQGWNMSTLNFAAEYDFADEEHSFGPRIGVEYNLIVGGHRIYNTSIGGGYLGIDIAWDLI